MVLLEQRVLSPDPALWPTAVWFGVGFTIGLITGLLLGRAIMMHYYQHALFLLRRAPPDE
jgi:hypothetical protein